MTTADELIFFNLFKEVYQKCFGYALQLPLTETESKHLAGKVLEETGLVIGAKSIKNYSSYVLQVNESKKENPSVATLDTMARYILNAPYTTEPDRKEKESNYPYWFAYKNNFRSTPQPEEPVREEEVSKHKKRIGFIPFFIATLLLFIIVLVVYFSWHHTTAENFVDRFNTVQKDSLAGKGWMVKHLNQAWWNKRDSVPKHLTLFTLKGDNWADSLHKPAIENLMLRSISAECFSTEIHLDNFMPRHNWQQAGILLMEDSTVDAKSLRVSISYNDFFGGYQKPPEIIVQAIISGSSDFSKPEEIAHVPLYALKPGEELLVQKNLQKAALRIEKTGNRFRILYAAGSMENFAFKEVFNKEIVLHPKFVGLFALQGFVERTDYTAASFNYFEFSSKSCAE